MKKEKLKCFSTAFRGKARIRSTEYISKRQSNEEKTKPCFLQVEIFRCTTWDASKVNNKKWSWQFSTKPHTTKRVKIKNSKCRLEQL